MTGYVYVVQSSSGLYKVGHTTRPHRRRAELIVATHEDLTMLGVVPATIEQERELHQLLKPWRVAREWYRPCTALLPLINGLRALPKRRKRPRKPLRDFDLSGPNRALLADIHAFLVRSGIGPAYFGKVAANNSSLIPRLEEGRPVLAPTERRIREFMAAREPTS